jgi:hypothetical protein
VYPFAVIAKYIADVASKVSMWDRKMRANTDDGVVDPDADVVGGRVASNVPMTERREWVTQRLAVRMKV